MATSIKIRERDKLRLDRLQGEIAARTGRKVSQQDLVARLLDLGESERSRLLEEGDRPMTAAEIRALNRLCVDAGVETSEDEIDAVVAQAVR